MADVSAQLADFLAETTRTPFAYGRRDCGLWLADWIELQRGIDPAAHVRGRYRTELGCARMLKQAGGLLELVRACSDRAGLAPTNAPKAGAIGVVRVMTVKGEGLAGAICTGPRWAILGGGGMMSLPVQPIAAWEV